MQSLWQDLKYAARLVGRSPGFTAVVVLTLALGIGANTAIFSLIDAVLLRTLPVRQPEQLVILDCLSRTGNRGSFSHTDFEWIRDGNNVFSGVSASTEWRVDWLNSGSKERVSAVLASGNFFSVLGVRTIVGRAFNNEDDRSGAAVGVISYDFWRNRFAKSPDVLGKTLLLDGTMVQIVGVAQPEFYGVAVGSAPEIWMPLSMQPRLNDGRSFLNTRNVGWLELMARLRPGMTPEKARIGLSVLYSAVQADLHIDPQNDALNRIGVSPGAGGFSYLRARYSEPLHVLMVIVALVLLIACTNVSNLLLVRSASRRREFAVRLALGAPRSRIVRQLLTESFLLSLAAGILGLGLALVVDRILIRLTGATTIDVGLNWELLVFTAVISSLTAFGFGVVPSTRSAGEDPARGTSLGSRAIGDNSRQRRFSNGLVALQIAISFVLIVTAGLFIKSLQNLRNFDPGFERAAVIEVGVDPSYAGYKADQSASLGEQLIQRVRAVPGVKSASASVFTFGGGTMTSCCFTANGRPSQRDEEKAIRVQQTSPGYFNTMGIPLMGGRDFSSTDKSNEPDVAIINETMAHRFFADQDPIGQHFGWAQTESNRIEIVGVVRDVRYDSLREKTPPMIYQSLQQHPNNLNYLEVRVSQGSNARLTAMMADIRSAIKGVNAALPITQMSSMRQVVDTTLVQDDLVAQLASAFSILAFTLALIGIYGVLSYTTARRTREIGVRMALGAQRTAIRWMVLREILFLSVAGLIGGGIMGLLAQRLIASELFELAPTDPAILALSAGFVFALSIAAGYVPAHRAAKVDPMEALRYE